MCYDNRHQTLESYKISVSFQGFSKLSDSTQTKLLKIKKKIKFVYTIKCFLKIKSQTLNVLFFKKINFSSHFDLDYGANIFPL
jgi:hypothetical protein